MNVFFRTSFEVLYKIHNNSLSAPVTAISYTEV